jgi:hypothetical protein
MGDDASGLSWLGLHGLSPEGEACIDGRLIPHHQNQRRRSEPSTWAMMILDFMGLGFMGYRRSMKAAVTA